MSATAITENNVARLLMNFRRKGRKVQWSNARNEGSIEPTNIHIYETNGQLFPVRGHKTRTRRLLNRVVAYTNKRRTLRKPIKGKGSRFSPY
jgi:hypothetical protein